MGSDSHLIGVTGASGLLGSAIMRAIPDAIPIGRSIPTERFDAIIHAAKPRDITQAWQMDGFNLALRQYCNRHRPRLVVVGSCWQILEGSSLHTEYAKMKRKQAGLFPEATHVVPYWIYGEGAGFPWRLVEAMRQGRTFMSAGSMERDFIYVDDVARDVVTALGYQPGETFASCTGLRVSPADLASGLGFEVFEREPEPSTILAYPLGRMSNPETDLRNWIRASATP